MLRESSRLEGSEVNLQVVVGGHEGEDSLPGEKQLLGFAETALYFDKEATKLARENLIAELGEAAMIDSACIIANFQRMVRIADGTGIPLDTPVALVTTDLREKLGINEFGSAENTPEISGLGKIIGRILGKILPLIFRQMAKKS